MSSLTRAALLLIIAVPLRAGNVSIYWLHNLAVQYEGTGYRQTPSGWELKVKPQSSGQGLRYRGERFQLQYWRNNPYFSWEDGNSGGPVMRQTGQTRLAFQALQGDGRFPLFGSSLEAVAGLTALHAGFERKEILFNGVRHPGGVRESLSAVGPAFGLHAAGEHPLGRWTFWTDAEASTCHFLWTRNAQRTGGGSISREGFGYLLRAEAGLKRGPWRLSAGLTRQMYEVLVPGGKGLPNGAAASLPINKIDFQSPFLAVSRELP